MPKRKLTEEESELIREIVQPYMRLSDDPALFPYESEIWEGYIETVDEFAKKLKQLLYNAEDCKIAEVIMGIPKATSQKGLIDNFLPSREIHRLEERIDEPLAKLFRLVGDKAEKCKMK